MSACPFTRREAYTGHNTVENVRHLRLALQSKEQLSPGGIGQASKPTFRKITRNLALTNDQRWIRLQVARCDGWADPRWMAQGRAAGFASLDGR